MPVLKSIGYEGPLTLEVKLDEYALQSHIAYSYQSLSYIETLLQGDEQ